jgi:hypothetical protein
MCAAMSAGAGLFLFLLPLAALPVVFHLLMRRRRKKLLFSTLMFFHRVDPKLSSRRRLREILLLACRVLLIALVLLTLARLTLHSTGGLLGLHGTQAVVVVLDNSASMSGPAAGGGGQAKLSLAVEGARALLTHLDEGADAAVVLLVPDPATGFESAGMTADTGGLARSLDRVTPTDGTGNVARALSRAQALLRATSPGGAGAIHIFTDLQEAEWAQQKVDERLLAEQVHVVFHRVPSVPAEGPNVAIVQAELIGRRILPRQPYNVQVVLRNDGPGPAKIRLNSEDDQRKTTTEPIEMAAGKEKTVTLLVQPESPGYHWVKVWVEGDSFQGDNRAAVGYLCESKALVLLAGTAEAYGVLPHALSPFGDGRFTSLVLGYAKVEDLRGRVEQDRPALVVLTWHDLAKVGAADWLQEYITRGGNLAVLPGIEGPGAAGTGPAWLGVAVGPRQSLTEEAPVQVIDGTAPFWSGLKDAEGRLRLGPVRARRYCPLTLPKDKEFAPLLGLGPEKILLAAGRMGQGQIVLSGLAFDPGWTSLPRLKSIVVLAQTMALGGKAPEAASLSLVAGTAPDALPGKGDQVHIVSLVGDPLDWSGLRSTVPAFPRSGAYSVRVGEESFCLSVRSSDREGGNRFIETGVVPALGRAPHTVRTLSESDLQEALTASRTGLPLYLPFLILAALGLVAESLLGAPPARKRLEQKGRAAQAVKT